MFDTKKVNLLGIRDQMRMSNVERWQIMRTHRQQNVAEHTCNVMLIAMDIIENWEHNPDQSGRPEEGIPAFRNAVLMTALYHDLAEVVLGDLPSPLKDALSGPARENLRAIEQTIEPRYVVNGLAADVLKAADLMDAIHFLRELGQDEHAMNVKMKLGKKFDAVIRNTRAYTLREAMETTYANLASGKQTFLEDLV